MCIKKLLRLFKKKEPAPAPGVPLEELQWKSPRMFRRIRNFFRRAPTSHAKGFPNMPKFQNCPDCNRPAKRDHKDARGAMYRCRCGLQNFVTHPLIIKQERLETARRRKSWPKKALAASVGKK